MHQGDIDLPDPVSPFLGKAVCWPFLLEILPATQHCAPELETDSHFLWEPRGRRQKNATERSQHKSNVPTPAITAMDHWETYPCKFVIQLHS